MSIADYFPKSLFKGRTVFVTGGGSGINLGIAKAFAALGAHVAICGRKLEKLQAASAEIEAIAQANGSGGNVFFQPADVRAYEALELAMANCRQALGPIDVLVCGAAGNFLTPAEALSANGFKTVIDIDLLGSFNAARAAFEQLKETKGCITFISAGQSIMPYAFQVHAGAAKAGIDNMMKNLALEWGRYGIRANSIIPGPIANTEGMNRLSNPAQRDALLAAIPMGRMGSVDEIGYAAAFLASPMAAYVTGAVLGVDGGSNLAGSGRFNAGAAEAMKAMAAAKA